MGSTADPGNPEIPVAIVSWNAGRILVNGLADLKQRIDMTLKPQSAMPQATLSFGVDVDRQTFPTQNVLGIVEGSDPTLRQEMVVVGAHYDHDGESDGQIWYGADDNASGTAALIELAEAFAGLPAAPRRSIVLAAFAGEEKGQIGSHYYVSRASTDQMIAMFQLDMIGRNEEHPADPALGLDRETSAGNANHVNVIGSTFSPDLARQVREANTAIGLTLEFRYDQTREVLLRRSDQWPFLQKRIPALFIHTGEHPDYHRPSDTADKINYSKLEKIVRLIYVAVERTANAAVRPQFQEAIR
jgi:Zn-dependent M28 family amino/carboxypeptidase